MKASVRTWVRAFGGAAVVITSILSVGCSSSDSPSAVPAEATGTLYTRLGQHDGIAKAVDAIVQKELMDPEVASYFYYQTQPGGPVAGHPSAMQIKACFVNLLGQAAGGPEQYPGSPTDSAGFQCRSMRAAHATLGIPSGVFMKFMTIAAGVLTDAKVAPDDLNTIAKVLTAEMGDVVQDTTRTDGNFIPPTH
jgi:hypothetical protein